VPEAVSGTDPLTSYTPIGFAGAFTDATTGYLYLVNRYYDPVTAQFLTVDPDVATTHQPYEYASDDPVSLTDPSGDDCAGGPTTPTALANFAAVYGGWQLEELSAATAGYHLQQFAAAVVASQQSQFQAKKFIFSCLGAWAINCGLINPNLPTPTLKDSDPKVEVQAPKGSTDKTWPIPLLPIPETGGPAETAESEASSFTWGSLFVGVNTALAQLFG
jgi:RHS repeat-associated protein